MHGGQGYFLTGTDTEVGKTFAACALLHAFQRQGRAAVGMKPVAAGTDESGRNDDVERLIAASGVQAPRALVNPYCFASPIAPHLAAAEEGRAIEPAAILDAYAQLAAQADVVLVEGVGGFRVPLGEGFDTADLAQVLGLPVILVVGLRLGCLNHALLTAEAIARRGLRLAGWIANAIDPAMARSDDNVATLAARLPAPLLGLLPHRPDADPAAVAGCLRLPD